jgi:hypothetical protein
VAKATFWACFDTQTRKHGERTGLETPVVHAVNDVDWAFASQEVSAAANALSRPPGEYDRKVKTQRN